MGFITSLGFGVSTTQNSLSKVLICPENSTTLQDCRFSTQQCNSRNYVVIICQNLVLTGSTNSNEGRVEVIYNGIQGLVCDDAFTQNSANVVCRQLGFSGAANFTHMAHNLYGLSAKRFLLDNLVCTGTEFSINQCSHSPWGQHNCHSTETVGVHCTRNLATSEELSIIGMYPNGGFLSLSRSYVCVDTFTSSMANTACKNLGFYSAIKYRGVFSNLNLLNLRCSENVTEIENCQRSSESCYSRRAVEILCQNIALVDGKRSSEGRVEVIFNKTRGLLCDDGFNRASANVVCRQLGFSNSTSFEMNAHLRYGYSNKTFLLDDLVCSGTENNINQCRHSRWGNHNCGPSETTGVRCTESRGSDQLQLVDGYNNHGRLTVGGRNICARRFSKLMADMACRNLGFFYAIRYHGIPVTGSMPASLNCSPNEISLENCQMSNQLCYFNEAVLIHCQNLALVGGPNNREGRVEVVFGKRRGLLCDDGFNRGSANVVCRQLGFNGVISFLHSAHSRYGNTNKIFLLDDLVCNGTESSINQCRHSAWGRHNCGYSETVGVVCRLGLNIKNGFHNKGKLVLGESSICAATFSETMADLACRNLGFLSTINYHSEPTNDTLINLHCSGNEINIADCNQTSQICSANMGVNIFCQNLALAGSTNRNEGRVEVIYNSQRGLLCDDGFSLASANVVCRQLGFDRASNAYHQARNRYGLGNGNFLLDDLRCSGTENDINQCRHSPWLRHDCSSHEVSGVVCVEDSLTIVGGYHNHGLLSIGSKSICVSNFTKSMADMACQNLGFLYALSYWGVPGTDSSFVSLDCPKNETLLKNCQITNLICRLNQAVNIFCQNLVLVGGSNEREGRVEVIYNNTRGLICDDSFNNNSATVVCRQLEFKGAVSFSHSTHTRFGMSNRSFLLDDLVCRGTEFDINRCNHRTWGSHNCGSSETVGVVCRQ